MNNEKASDRFPSGAILLLLGIVALILLARSGVFKLFGTIANTADKALKTASNAAAQLDPFNPRGALHKAGDKIGASKPAKTLKNAADMAGKAAAQLDPFNKKGLAGKPLVAANKAAKAVGKVFKKLF